MRSLASFFAIFLAFFWLITSWLHLADVFSYSLSISNYQLVDVTTATWLAYFFPNLQVFLGLALLSRVWIQASLALSSLLLFIYTFAGTSAWLYSLDIPCGCFGEFSPKIGLLHIAMTLSVGIISAIFAWVFK